MAHLKRGHVGCLLEDVLVASCIYIRVHLYIHIFIYIYIYIFKYTYKYIYMAHLKRWHVGCLLDDVLVAHVQHAFVGVGGGRAHRDKADKYLGGATEFFNMTSFI